jgi:tRNA A37 threonylcarbamoyladenosine synthetase subunit TsaC/SUA5/YrdC
MGSLTSIAATMCGDNKQRPAMLMAARQRTLGLRLPAITMRLSRMGEFPNLIASLSANLLPLICRLRHVFY